MSMTITEKIIAAHCGRDSVRPGDLVDATVDFALANDITAPLAIDEFEQAGGTRVFDPERIALVPDHYTPAKDVLSAEQARKLREFSRRMGIKYYFEIGTMGIEHALLPEQGLTLPGELIIGADSHTVTYGALGAFATGVGSTDLAAVMLTGRVWLRVPETVRLVYRGALPKWVVGKDLILHTIGDIGVAGARYQAMEFAGEAIGELSMDSRMTMANMAIEAGGKNGIIEPDEKTEAYLEGRAKRPYTIVRGDADAEYVETREYDVSGLEPVVAFPHLPSNTRPVSEVGTVEIDQVVIGSCTNGRMEDLRLAAEVLRGRSVSERVRAIVIPGTQRIMLEAMKEGLIAVFIEAGAAVSTPTCGPCIGGHMGVLAAGERAVATTNRNFRGRMGHPESEIYLANPAVAAASAVAGRITGPEEL